MKLLIDENLPESILQVLDDRFTGSTHVRATGLESSDDTMIWNYAKENGFALLTQDSDYERMASLLGAPPHVILVRMGNLRPPALRSIFATYLDAIEQFLRSEDGSVLSLTRPRNA